jgi:hypothetical protein
MRTKDAVAPAHVCPGIRIHAIDIVHPPGIGIASAAGIALHQTAVTATQTTNTIATSKMKVRRDAFSETTRPRVVIEMQASKLLARNAGFVMMLPVSRGPKPEAALDFCLQSYEA